MLRAAVCGHLGRVEEARQVWDEALGVNPKFSLDQRRAVLPKKEFALLTEGLGEARLPPSP